MTTTQTIPTARGAFVLLTVLMGLHAATPAYAQVRSGLSSDQSGNASAGASRYDTATVNPQARTVRMVKNLDCSLLRKNVSCGSITLETRPTKGRALVRIGPKRVFSRRISKSGSYQFGPYMLDIFRVPPFEIFDLGLVSIKASGEAGAGAQFGGTWSLQRKPPQAALNGAGQTYGNASGRIKATVLYGAASAEANATLNFFNSTLKADLHATPSGVNGSHASLDVILWELWLRLKAKVLGATVADKTIVHETGPTFSVTLL